MVYFNKFLIDISFLCKKQKEDFKMESKEKKPLEEITFNTTGKTPSYAGWEYTEAEANEIMLKVARSFVPSFADATIEWDTNTGDIAAYVWIHSNDKNIVDNSLQNNPAAAFNVAIPKTSQVLKDFANKFCVQGHNRPFMPTDNSLKLVGYLVDLRRIFAVHSDTQGFEFEKIYGYRPARMNVEVIAHFSHKGDIKCARLDYIEVIKRRQKRISSSKPVARKSFKH